MYLKKINIFFLLWGLSSCSGNGPTLRYLASDTEGKTEITIGDFKPSTYVSYRDYSGVYTVTDVLSYTDSGHYAEGFNIAVSIKNPGEVAYRTPSTPTDDSPYASVLGAIKIYEDVPPYILLGYTQEILAMNQPDAYINLQKPIYRNKPLKVFLFFKNPEGKESYMALPPILIRAF